MAVIKSTLPQQVDICFRVRLAMRGGTQYMILILKKINISLTIVFSLLTCACADSNSSHQTCLKSAVESAAASAQTDFVADATTQSETSDNLSLIIKVKNVAQEIQGLRQELVKAHGPFAVHLGKLTITAINSELIALQIPKGSPAIVVIKQKVAAKEILYAEPDYNTFMVEPGALDIFSDPDLTKQWAQKKIDTFDAWKTTRGDRALIVAVIDTGVDYTHKDLQHNIWRNQREIINGKDDDNNGYIDDVYGYDFSNNDNNPMSDDTGSFHGTHVAGTIAATLDNKIGGAGIAPNVKIMALKYLNQNGTGRTSDAIRAIDYAIQNGAKIINNSWGSLNRSQALQDSIEKARQSDVLFVAAAGNGDISGHGINLDKKPFYPASFSNDNVVSVAATDKNDNLTKWSNYGRALVDVAAPGANILSTRNGNTYAVLSGTSMATPAVAGVLSLIWSANPHLKYFETKKILLDTVDKIETLKTKIASAGRVNAARAVLLAINFQATSDTSLRCFSSE